MRAKGFHSSVMKQHWLMKQQTITTKQKGAQCSTEESVSSFLPSLPFTNLLSLVCFPVFHTLLQVCSKQGLSDARIRKSYYFLTERHWEIILVYSEITDFSCNNPSMATERKKPENVSVIVVAVSRGPYVKVCPFEEVSCISVTEVLWIFNEL